MGTYARRNDLVSQSVESEVLVYDPSNAHCHLLAKQAAALWEALSETHEVEGLVDKLALEWPETTAATIESLLAEFQAKGLLAPGCPKPRRRKLLQAMGSGLLLSAIAPAAAAAVSSNINIINARYGANIATRFLCGNPGVSLGGGNFANVTTIIQGLITGNTLSIPVNNSGVLGSGPLPALRQELIVGYNCTGGGFQQTRTCDGGVLVINCP